MPALNNIWPDTLPLGLSEISTPDIRYSKKKRVRIIMCKVHTICVCDRQAHLLFYWIELNTKTNQKGHILVFIWVRFDVGLGIRETQTLLLSTPWIFLQNPKGGEEFPKICANLYSSRFTADRVIHALTPKEGICLLCLANFILFFSSPSFLIAHFSEIFVSKHAFGRSL